jgi:hypothetical protein
MYVVVFRQEVESGSYQLIHGPEELTHSTIPGALTVEWPIQSGDMLGALIPSSCMNMTSGLACPSQINLRTDPMVCSSALYHPFDTDTGLNLRSIPVNQFEEVQVHLNMEFSIKNSCE